MSHPLLVEAIETEFVPLLVFNNRDEDAAIIRKFREPAWNNPIVRYLIADGSDVIPRAEGAWTISETAKRMIAALDAAKRDVPDYLRLVAGFHSTKLETATFAMHCFWTGEARLGNLDGVWKTEAGWLNGLEVVRVAYDPTELNYAELIQTAQSMECASIVFAHNDQQFQTAKKSVGQRAVRLKAGQTMKPAKDSDQLYYLRTLGRVKQWPLTYEQAYKVNARIGNQQEPYQWLSPRQIEAVLQARRGSE